MALIKVIGNEKTSLKIILARAETTEIMLRTVSKHKMAIIKVIGNENTSLKIISAKSQFSKIAENGPKMVSKMVSK